eukprot:75962_1
MSTATITWQITGKELVSFVHAKNNKIYKSNAFYISSSHGSAKFQLECYSNGMNKGEEGSVDLFLKIVSLPEHASDITLRYILECLETNTSFSKIKTFNRETTNSCWPYNTLHLSELIKLKIVTFVCNVKILSIEYKKTKSVIGTITNYFCGDHHSNNSYSLKMDKYTSFVWNIIDIEYDNFMNCSNRKQIHSESFGFGHHYQLECYPNGTKLDQRGNVIMGLSLLSLPPLISSVKLFYCFKCIQCNKEWSNVHNFSYKSSVKGWPMGLIKQDLLYKLTKNTKQITFKCNIEILKLYDDQNTEISPKHFHRFIIDNTNHTNAKTIRRDSTHSFEDNLKDIEIATLNSNIITLQQTVDIMKKEIYALRDRTHGAQHLPPKLKKHHSAHPQHVVPPVHVHKKRHHHPRSISDVDQLAHHLNHYEYNPAPKHRDFYPFHNSISVDRKEYNQSRTYAKHQKRKTYHGHGAYDYNKYKKHPISPLDDGDPRDSKRYKNWYYDPIKEKNERKKKSRKKTDEGFSSNMRSFVEVNKIIGSDLVKEMETNEVHLDDRYEYDEHPLSDLEDEEEKEPDRVPVKRRVKFDENHCSNPFFKQQHNSVKINDEYEYEYDGQRYHYDNRDVYEAVPVKEGGSMAKAKSMGTPTKRSRQSKSNDRKSNKKHKKHRKLPKDKSDQSKQFHRSQSEKKIHWNARGVVPGNEKQRRSDKPMFEEVDEEENDAHKLKRWMCHEMGFSSKYFNMFIQNDYDNMDIVMELKEEDLIQMGISNKKHRHRLLKEFSKYNPFRQDTLSGPPLPISGALI